MSLKTKLMVKCMRLCLTAAGISCVCLIYLSHVYNRRLVIPALRPGNFQTTNSNYAVDTVGLLAKYSLSHPLENSCHYPILNPNDVSIDGYVKHPRSITCNKVQPEFSSQDSDGYLYIHDDVNAVTTNLTKRPRCFYVGMEGTLRPDITKIKYASDWKAVQSENGSVGGRVWIPHDQYLIKCFDPKDKKQQNELYRQPYAHFPDLKDKKFISTSESDEILSVNVVILDSISLNQFKRHMSRTWPYMRDKMGFEWLEGYNKVGDNSMVNLLPVFTGLRYVNQSKDMTSDILPQSYENTVLDLENFTFFWDVMKEKGCVSFVNDDVGHYTRGLFHYPWKQSKGWRVKPADHFFRPYYVQHYKNAIKNSSYYCTGNNPMPYEHLQFVERYMTKYRDSCHVSFSFLTELTHNDGSRVETLDNHLYHMLHSMYNNAVLNKTILIIMGDHGNRISTIRFSFIGRFEERLPLFAIYFPEWFKRKHPKPIENLRTNRHRLTSNFDLFETLMDIAEQKWERSLDRKRRGKRGQSLFDKVSPIRSCQEAGIPEQYCTCMQPAKRPMDISSTQVQTALKLLELEYLHKKECMRISENPNPKIKILNATKFLMTQMVRHGLKYQDEASLKLLEATANLEIEYYEIMFEFEEHGLVVLGRFHNEAKFFPDRFHLNGEPFLVSGHTEKCPLAKTLAEYCYCGSELHNSPNVVF